MKFYMGNQEEIDSSDDFAKKLTTEYDNCIKRGFQQPSLSGFPIPLKTGKTDLMEMMVKSACATALNVKKGKHTFIDDIGKSIQGGYWVGAEMDTQIPPMGVTPPAFMNISTTLAMVSNSGVWTPIGPTPPLNDTNIFLDILIASMKIHLTTIAGTYILESLYPGVPVVKAPSLLPFIGYTVPPSQAEAPAKSDELVVDSSVSVPEQTDTLMSPAQIKSAKLEKGFADIVANDTTLPTDGRSSAKEYSNLKSSEISSGQINAVPVELSEEELKAIEENTPDEYKCEDGTKVVAIAKRDIGILEYGTPPGLNYGGFPGGKQTNAPGRIDEMFTNVGLDNQEKVGRSGSGYYWCAAAVATWWQEAGLQTPSGGASCDNWMSWGKQNGYWSTTPKVGAAILYGKPTDAYHIGIVAGVTPTGAVIAIEGNTSGGMFNSNGCGVFQKVPRKYLGFVLPPSCV